MVNISEVVERLQLELRKKGIHYLAKAKRVNSNLMVTCPYHKNGTEHSPSCGILLEDRAHGSRVFKAGTVHCFTCGETHTLEEMISHVFSKYDKGAFGKEWLLEHFDILSTDDIVFNYEFIIEKIEKPEVDYRAYETYHPYFKERGIEEKVAKAFHLGYDPLSKSVVLPLFDKQGKSIMLIKRALTEHIYMNTSGAAKTDSLFGIQVIYEKLSLLVNEPYVYIAEGPFDVLKMWQANKPAVGILQAAISETQIQLMKKLPFQKIVIATDNDEAGRKVAYKLAARLAETKEVFFMNYPHGVKDPGEMTDKQLKEAKLTPYHGQKSKTGFKTTLY